MENVLWAGGFVAQIVLLAVLITKKHFRDFPVFMGYVVFWLVQTMLLFYIFRESTRQAYFYAYWSSALADYALQIAVIYEIAKHVLRPTGTWLQDARKSFILWSLVGAIVAGAIAFKATPPNSTGIELLSFRSSIFTSFLTCEVFLAMITAANRLGLLWDSHVMALGQGLTAWAVVALLADIAQLATAWHHELRIFEALRSFASVAMVIFLSFAFAAPERERAPLSEEMREYLSDLHLRVQHDLQTLTSVDKS